MLCAYLVCGFVSSAVPAFGQLQPSASPLPAPSSAPATQPTLAPVVLPSAAPLGAPTLAPANGASTAAPPLRGLPPPPSIPVLPPVPNVAPGYSAPEIGAVNGELIGITQQPFVGITLRDVIGMVLSRNPDLSVAEAARRIAGYQIVAAQGAYDVRLFVEPTFSHTTQPPQNAFFSGPNFGPIVQNQTQLSAGVQGVTPGGQQYSVSASGSRIDNNTTINTFDPTYPSALSLNFTQPLGRRDQNDPRHALQLAVINAQTSRAQALLTASQTIANAEDTYWDLVAAWRNLAIQEGALREAEVQAASNRRLARAGAAAPIDIVSSNTQVNVFTDNVFSALQNVQRLQNTLKSLTLADPSDPIWAANLVPSTPVLTLPPEPALATVISQALAHRPEIDQLRAAAQIAAENVAYARDQTKPQVDLQLGYTSNGFAGQLVPLSNSPFLASSALQVAVINQLVALANASLPPSRQIPTIPVMNQTPPSYLIGNLDQSINNLLANKFPVYQASVRFAVPLGNRTAKANYAIAAEQVRETQLNAISFIERITAEARNALQTYRTARYRLIAARSARQASQSVLASEMRRFRNGVSTTFFVLQRQLDLANNRGRELQAQTDLNKAVVELQRVTGGLLGENNVDATLMQKESEP